MDKASQLKKVLEVCALRAQAADVRLSEALSLERTAAGDHRQAMQFHAQEVHFQQESRERNIAQLLAEPADQRRLSGIRLQYAMAAERVSAATTRVTQAEAEWRSKELESAQRREERQLLERRRQKLAILIDKKRVYRVESE